MINTIFLLNVVINSNIIDKNIKLTLYDIELTLCGKESDF